jgi:hypothetical protein
VSVFGCFKLFRRVHLSHATYLNRRYRRPSGASEPCLSSLTRSKPASTYVRSSAGASRQLSRVQPYNRQLPRRTIVALAAGLCRQLLDGHQSIFRASMTPSSRMAITSAQGASCLPSYHDRGSSDALIMLSMNATASEGSWSRPSVTVRHSTRPRSARLKPTSSRTRTRMKDPPSYTRHREGSQLDDTRLFLGVLTWYLPSAQGRLECSHRVRPQRSGGGLVFTGIALAKMGGWTDDASAWTAQADTALSVLQSFRNLPEVA